MVSHDDKVRYAAIGLIIVVALAVVIGLNVIGDDFCSNFDTSDNAMREAIAGISTEEVTCLPEGSLDLVEDIIRDVKIEGLIKGIHPNAFKSEKDLSKVTSFRITGLEGVSIDFPDNLLESMRSLRSITFVDVGAAINDRVLGDLDTLDSVSFRGIDFEVVPAFVFNQTRLTSFSVSGTSLRNIEENFFSEFEFISFISIFASTLEGEFDERGFTVVDLREFLGVPSFVSVFSRLPDSVCPGFLDIDETQIRRDIKNIMTFDSDTDTVTIGGFSECLPSNLFQELSEEELASFFPQDREISLVITAPLSRLLSADTFSAGSDFLSQVTSFTFKAPDFLFAPNDLTLSPFTGLKEVIFAEDSSGFHLNGRGFQTDFVGEPCRRSVIAMRFINMDFLQEFPETIRFCTSLETLDFSGAVSFDGLNEGVLEDLPNLKEIILTGTDLAVKNNISEIAIKLGIPEDIIVV